MVIGVASTAPAYSLAATLGLVAAAVGFQTPAIMILAFVPMLLVSVAYFYLNRADPDCGTCFWWVTRAMGPQPGWITGWAIIVADIVAMAALAEIAGHYTLLLFGAEGLAGSTAFLALGLALMLAQWRSTPEFLRRRPDGASPKPDDAGGAAPSPPGLQAPLDVRDQNRRHRAEAEDNWRSARQ